MASQLTFTDFQIITEKLRSSIDLLAESGHKEILKHVPDNFESLKNRMNSARGGYPLNLEKRASFNIDRLGSVLLGPVFTSTRFPWPNDADGTPLVPLCQLNTAHFPRQISDDLQGLIQVWLKPGDSSGEETHIRVIPTAEIDIAVLNPIISVDEDLDVMLTDAAEWMTCYKAGPRPSRTEVLTTAASNLGFNSTDEFADADWDKWQEISDGYDEKYGLDIVTCWQITGFETERIYIDISSDHASQAAKLNSLSSRICSDMTEDNKVLATLLKDFSSNFDLVMQACGESRFPCLFGTFSEIQYRAIDKGIPILCLESIGLKEWGDGGNAQIFFEDDKGLSFSWGCS